mmetsp:Transcript_75932/g.232412  ORF Transcript_75932/g.232412 Transcript_75932/m.232412 type:complete len:221 (-) Transcript_75932:644-1306(-)
MEAPGRPVDDARIAAQRHVPRVDVREHQVRRRLLALAEVPDGQVARAADAPAEADVQRRHGELHLDPPGVRRARRGGRAHRVEAPADRGRGVRGVLVKFRQAAPPTAGVGRVQIQVALQVADVAIEAPVGPPREVHQGHRPILQADVEGCLGAFLRGVQLLEAVAARGRQVVSHVVERVATFVREAPLRNRFVLHRDREVGPRVVREHPGRPAAQQRGGV